MVQFFENSKTSFDKLKIWLLKVVETLSHCGKVRESHGYNNYYSQWLRWNIGKLFHIFHVYVENGLHNIEFTMLFFHLPCIFIIKKTEMQKITPFSPKFPTLGMLICLFPHFAEKSFR